MKKLLFILVCLIAVSCKKERACTCTDLGGSKVVFTEKVTKKKASKDCKDYYDKNYGSIPLNETSCSIN